MYPRNINVEVRNAAEAAAVQQALAMVRELEEIANAAPDGQVLDQVEPAALDRGRRFMRDRFHDVLNGQAKDLEKKGGARGSAPAAGRDATKDARKDGS
jgi:hypothetical protein